MAAVTLQGSGENGLAALDAVLAGAVGRPFWVSERELLEALGTGTSGTSGQDICLRESERNLWKPR